MKTIVTIIVFFCGLMTHAQLELRKQSVDSGGAIAQSGSIKMLFTVGEVVVAEATSGSFAISEGFIGKDINLALGIDNFEELIGVKVYPNPVIDVLHVTLPKIGNYTLELYDMQGKLVNQAQTKNNIELEINIQEFKEANYFLLIKDNTNNTAITFKLIKK